MRKSSPILAVVACCLVAVPASRGASSGGGSTTTTPQFTFKDAHGKTQSITVVSKYYPKKIATPLARVDSSLNPKLMRAATIAQERAHAHSRSLCWRAVKEALLASGAVSSYPKTAYAKDAGQELVRSFGFKRLSVRDPFKAPVGSVLVYGASRAAGHVEIRTRDGFVSDFKSRIPSRRPLIGVFAKG